MLANVPRRHVRHYKQNPIVLTPTSSTLPSPGPHLTRPDSDGEDGIDTLVSSSASPTKYKGGLMITIPGEEARKPLPPTFEFKSAQPISLDLPANQPRADCPGTTVPGLGLPKRRTLAQRFRERKERRCVQNFPVDAGSPWHLALADPNLDGLDIEAEEEGFDTVIRIFHTDPDDDNDDNEEERRGSRWRDNRRIRREGGRVRVCSGKKIDLPAPKSELELSTVTGSDSRERLACTRTEIHLFIPKNPSDVGVTELTVAQMTFVSQFPDLGKVLLTTPPDRGVDALSLAAFCSAVAISSSSSSSPSSPGEMIRRFNESLDTPLDISADEASWRWRGSVSWDGMEALDEVCTDDTKTKTKSGEL